jgi:small conductance mechanosensitive channel
MNEILTSIWTKLNEVFHPDSLGEMVANWVIKLSSAVLVFLVFLVLWLGVRLIVKSILKRSKQDQTTKLFILNLIKYGILIIGGVNALKAGGVDIAAVLASLGIAGITIGFAARDAFSNLISGLLIFLDRPFVIGDLVEVGDSYGKVDAITLRSTRIVTPDGRMLAVPNAEMINKTVASYTNFPNLRLDIGVTIGVDEDIDRVRKLLLEIIEDESDFLETPPPQVLVQALNDYNVQIELRVWLKEERMHIPQRAWLRERVFKTLTQAGVDMPYETLRITPLDVNMSEN